MGLAMAEATHGDPVASPQPIPMHRLSQPPLWSGSGLRLLGGARSDGVSEAWARAFLMTADEKMLLRDSLLRPSTPFFGTCFVWQQRGSRRQVSLTRAPQRTLGRPARSRPATGDVTATDRYVLLRVVFGPSVAKKGLRASAGALADLPLFSDKQWHCSPCGAPAKSGRQKPSTGLVLTSPRRLFDDDTSEAWSASTLSAAGDRRPMDSSAKICADPLDRRVASVQGIHRPGHLLQLALAGLYWQ